MSAVTDFEQAVAHREAALAAATVEARVALDRVREYGESAGGVHEAFLGLRHLEGGHYAAAVAHADRAGTCEHEAGSGLEFEAAAAIHALRRCTVILAQIDLANAGMPVRELDPVPAPPGLRFTINGAQIIDATTGLALGTFQSPAVASAVAVILGEHPERLDELASAYRPDLTIV